MSKENYQWPFDPLLARELGFDYFAVGGSRSYNVEDHSRLAGTDEEQDWDLIGIVKTKNDILSLVLDNASRLNFLLGISLAENVRWQALSESSNTGWTVLRYSGFAKDKSKRSLKIISYDELLSILVEPTAVDIGVLSGRLVRKFRCHHPINGRIKIVYQPLRYSEDLRILHDVDIVCPSGDHSMAFAGVTIDLFLTSTPLLDVFPETIKRLVRKFLVKWATTTNSPSHLSLVPTLLGSQNFDTCFAERLKKKFREASEGLPQHKQNSSRPWLTHLRSGRNKRFEFWPLKQDYWVDSFIELALPQKEPLYPRPMEFVLDPHQQYSPSPFTSNSTGGFGKLRLPDKAEWQSAFMKRSTQTSFELSALVDVQRYFPKHRAQEVLAVDDALGIIYFRVYQGITLNEHRLAWHISPGLNNGKVQNHVVDWFLDIELQRAEQVTDVYRKTMTMDALPSQFDKQRIHRFYYQRLCSDNRLREFYEKSISSICNHQIATLSDFLNLQVYINGVACASLRCIFDKALAILDPKSATGLSSLPVAFGLGDSHGGNIMISPDKSPEGYIHIDYEVAGLHCPFLDIAKGIYLDGFFNALYADLLTDSIVGHRNKSGAMVTWDIRDNILYIDYEFEADEIGEAAGFTKLEYILRPTLEHMMRYSLSSAKLAEDILSSALLCCATLTRNFSERPDVFFLNLALGVDLADNMMAVFRKAFQWNPPLHWPSLNSEVGKCLVGDDSPSNITMSLLEQDFLSFIASSGLLQDDVFLKRAEDTFQMQKRFSRSKDESQGQIIQRIDHVRRLGMKIAPHTCIRESIFAEPRVDHHFAYHDILSARSKGDLLVDVGCCMGSDIRKLILDGYPSKNITGLDIESRFFELGRMLYNEKGPQNGPHFHCADLTDLKFTSTHSNLTGRFKFVHTANVLHLFDVGKQEVFFRNLIFMTEPGGIIWGRQVGLAPDHLAQHRQPLGKGYRFTLNEFRDWCLNIGGWETADAQFHAQLVEYDEIRGKRLDKNWVLQWRVTVPESRGKEHPYTLY